jgi:hypothetical protein
MVLMPRPTLPFADPAGLRRRTVALTELLALADRLQPELVAVRRES